MKQGEVLARLFSHHQLGLVIGRRTLGSAIGIRTRHELIDSTITMQFEYHFDFPHPDEPLVNRGHPPGSQGRQHT